MKDTFTDERAYYRSLTRKMMAVIIAVSLTPLILISGLTREYFAAVYREKVVSQLEEKLLRHRYMIDDFLTDRLGALRVEANDPQFGRLLDRSVLREHLALVQQEFGQSFEDLGVVNEKGIQVAYAGPHRLQGADYSDAPWFKQAINRDHFVSDVFAGLRGYPHLVIAVRREFEGQKWLLRASIEVDSLNAMVHAARTGASGLAFIVNSKGEYQTKLPGKFDGSLKPFVDFAASNTGPTDEVRAMENEGAAGSTYLYVMSRLNDGRWVLGFAQSVDEALGAILVGRSAVIAIFVVGALGIVMGSYIISRRMVNRIASVAHEKQVINQQLVEAGKLASLGELAAGIAHEINNPVGIMVQEAGWIQDLLDDGEPREEDIRDLKSTAHKIVVQGRRCKEITHKLLSFARKTDPAAKTSQLNDLIKEVISLIEQRARYSKVKLVTQLQDDLPMVHVPPSEMQQVLLNMINNSLDAMEDKGGTIEVRSRQEEDFAVIEVEDNGSGIPQAQMAKIFEPFFTTKPVGKGTGLGLSICYGIIRKLGGNIAVESAVGKGTTFHIKVPMREKRAAFN